MPRGQRDAHDRDVVRVLLVLASGTYKAADFLVAASSLSAEVVVVSDHLLAVPAEGRALTVDLDDPDAAAATIAAFAADRPVDAVVAADDRGVVAAAVAARRLGLAHNPPAAVAATRDKAAQRRALTAAGRAQPRWRLARAADDVEALAAQVGFPCVVKPVSLSGSRGVIRADDATAALVATARIRGILAVANADPFGPILVESFVPGGEVAVEALLRGGELTVLAVFDKPDPLDGPYFEETIYVTPSRLPPATLATVERAAAAAAAALGLVEGPVHAELRVDGDRVVVLELAARTIGGLCARTLRFGAGISLEEVVLHAALGRPLDGLCREVAASGVMMLPIPRSGVLDGVGGVDAARAVPGVVGVELSIPPGRRVWALPEGDRYLGFVFARGATPAAVEQALRTAHAQLDVRIR